MLKLRQAVNVFQGASPRLSTEAPLAAKTEEGCCQKESAQATCLCVGQEIANLQIWDFFKT